jgi:phage portal protein BeeE
MQIKTQLKQWALKQLGYNPVLGAGFAYNFGRAFTWLNGNGISGYNNKIVYAGLNLKIRKLVEPDMIVYKVKNKKALRTFYKNDTSNNARVVSKAIALDEIDEHPLIELLERPNDFQTGIELMEQFWFNYEFGDGYLIALGSQDGPGADSRKFKPNYLYAPNRNRVLCEKSNDPFNPISVYRITLNNGEQLTLDPNQVFHLKKWNPENNEVNGHSFMNPAGKTVSKNEENQTAQGSAYMNGGRGTIFSSDLMTDGAGGVVEKMTGDQMSKLKDAMIKDYTGSVNNRKMNFINGKVEVQNYGDTLAEMELIDAEKADWRDMYAVLGIPVALGPDTSASTESNVKAGYKALVTNTIVPELRKFDMKFKRWIELWYGLDIIASHDLTEFNELAPDLELLSKVYGKPTLSEDERRALFNFDEMSNGLGKTMLVPSGLMTLEQITEPMEEPDPEGKQYDYQMPGKTEKVKVKELAPIIELDFISARDLVGSSNPAGFKSRQDSIKRELNRLKQEINYLYA